MYNTQRSEKPRLKQITEEKAADSPKKFEHGLVSQFESSDDKSTQIDPKSQEYFIGHKKQNLKIDISKVDGVKDHQAALQILKMKEQVSASTVSKNKSIITPRSAYNDSDY